MHSRFTVALATVVAVLALCAVSASAAAPRSEPKSVFETVTDELQATQNSGVPTVQSIAGLLSGIRQQIEREQIASGAEYDAMTSQYNLTLSDLKAQLEALRLNLTVEQQFVVNTTQLIKNKTAEIAVCVFNISQAQGDIAERDEEISRGEAALKRFAHGYQRLNRKGDVMLQGAIHIFDRLGPKTFPSNTDLKSLLNDNAPVPPVVTPVANGTAANATAAAASNGTLPAVNASAPGVPAAAASLLEVEAEQVSSTVVAAAEDGLDNLRGLFGEMQDNLHQYLLGLSNEQQFRIAHWQAHNNTLAVQRAASVEAIQAANSTMIVRTAEIVEHRKEIVASTERQKLVAEKILLATKEAAATQATYDTLRNDYYTRRDARSSQLDTATKIESLVGSHLSTPTRAELVENYKIATA